MGGWSKQQNKVETTWHAQLAAEAQCLRSSLARRHLASLEEKRLELANGVQVGALAFKTLKNVPGAVRRGLIDARKPCKHALRTP